jgi:peptidoglycan/LPS O-acetylase OafA/YrhL
MTTQSVASQAGAHLTADDRKSSHIPALDGLRGLAILAVMLSHITVMVPASPADRAYFQVVDSGWMGVDLFFVLSGFLITGILFDSRPNPHYFRNFYMRRVLRIFPLYYIYLTLMLVIAPHLHSAALAAQGTISGSSLWYWLYASNVRFAMHGFDSQVLSITWSLAVEEHFYLVWPVVVLTFGRRTLLWICLGIAAAALGLRIACVISEVRAVIPYTFTACRMDSLAIGAAVALLARGPVKLTRLRRPAVFAVPLGALLVVALFAADRSTFWANRWILSVGFTVISGVCAAALVLVLTGSGGSIPVRFLNSAILRKFGKYSYCLYLVHALVRSGVRDFLYKPARFLTIAGSQIPGQLIFYVIVIGASLLIAILSWELVEKRILSLKRLFPERVPVAGNRAM